MQINKTIIHVISFLLRFLRIFRFLVMCITSVSDKCSFDTMAVLPEPPDHKQADDPYGAKVRHIFLFLHPILPLRLTRFKARVLESPLSDVRISLSPATYVMKCANPKVE